MLSCGCPGLRVRVIFQTEATIRFFLRTTKESAGQTAEGGKYGFYYRPSSRQVLLKSTSAQTMKIEQLPRGALSNIARVNLDTPSTKLEPGTYMLNVGKGHGLFRVLAQSSPTLLHKELVMRSLGSHADEEQEGGVYGKSRCALSLSLTLSCQLDPRLPRVV